MSAEILRLFAALPLPPGDSPAGRFAAQPIPSLPSCSIGKDAAGHPVLLVETDEPGPRGQGAPIILEHLSVLHNVDCRLQPQDGGASTRRCSVVRCCGDDRLLHEYFLRALAPILGTLPPRPQRRQVDEAINAVIELFRSAARSPLKTVLGLWAELFVIQGASDPTRLIRCWHALPEDRFDFADGGQRLEVKAANGRLRAHYFSHEQLCPPAGARSVIASVLLERCAGGQSVTDLVEQIRGQVADHQLLVQLDAVVALTLGTEWRAAHEDRFDRQLAAESLRFLDSRTIPSIPAVLPPEVTEVRFRVDLTNHPLTLPEDLCQGGSLFMAMLPP